MASGKVAQAARKHGVSIFVLAPKGRKGGASSAQAMRKLRGKITGKAPRAEGLRKRCASFRVRH